MKIITLTKGFEAIVDDDDFVSLSKTPWCYANGYAIRREGPRGASRVMYMHKQVMGFNYTDKMVDHINRNKLDNRKENLRLANKTINSQNRDLQKNNTSGYKGVSIYGDKFAAYIKYQGRKIHLGYFSTAKGAAAVYNEAAMELFGTYARLNDL